jgi:hypothetical protein
LPDTETVNTGVKIIGYFESKYNCSGICTKPPLFYYTLDLSVGIPEATCLQFLKQEIINNILYLGITCIITAFVIFWAWIV